MTTKSKPKPKPKKPGGRKKGAQADNTNALKHGFYAKRFKPEQKKRLDSQDPKDVTAEINLIRVCVDNLLDELSFKEITRTDNNGTEFRDSHYLSQLNTLTLMVTSVSGLIRTDYLIKGKTEGIETPIMEALEIIRLELGLE
jgi:hypothetical protein